MADAFVLPADLGLTLESDSFSLNHPGDVTLGQTLGRRLKSVTAGGDLTLNLANITGRIHADGIVRITGPVNADTIHGREVHLDTDQITARAISATERIVIGSATLKCDILLAPDIQIDGDSRGKVTVIECNGDLPPSRIRGGYTLAEYEEDFGDSAAFLADRGVSALGETPHAPVATTLNDELDNELDAEDDDSDDDDDDDDDDDEDLDDPVSLPNVELTPVHDVEDDDDELYPKLAEALDRIVSCYDDELPPSVLQLQSAIGSRDYDTLRANITDVWTGLLGYHQQRGIRPHHQVTHAFNVIHGLVTEG